MKSIPRGHPKGGLVVASTVAFKPQASGPSIFKITSAVHLSRIETRNFQDRLAQRAPLSPSISDGGLCSLPFFSSEPCQRLGNDEAIDRDFQLRATFRQLNGGFTIMSPLKAVFCTELICLRRCHFKSAMSAMMNAKATPPTIPPIIAPRWLGFEWARYGSEFEWCAEFFKLYVDVVYKV
ncbi:hypothetical protein LENED_006967 [Lentinula edodes]|uniref:Uncharacterized protein n=1 Tax=Lentinula edodes TaxID=5353 RepID=A0A1Q3ED81_LENED|nr:hypothetical protein LENED_006967 [Lentinula edodes]